MATTPVRGTIKQALPVCDWMYFATTAKEGWTVTKLFVSTAKLIFAHAYNSRLMHAA